MINRYLYVNLNTCTMNYSVKYYPEKRKDIIDNVPMMLSVTYLSLRQGMFLLYWGAMQYSYGP